MEAIEVMDTLDLDMLDMEDMVLDTAVDIMERGPLMLMLSPRQMLMLICMEDMEAIEVMDTLVLDTAVDIMERGPLTLSPRQRLMLIFMEDMEAIEVMDTLDLDMLDMEDMVLDTAVVSTMDKKKLSAFLKQKLKVISD